MLCQHCKKNNATLYYKQTINGKTSEYALCPDCAEALKQNGKLDLENPFSTDGLFGSLFGSEFLSDDFFQNGLLAGMLGSERKESRKSNIRCPLCHASFDDLVKSGRVGCAECYRIFSGELAPTIASIHGKSKHTGRFPKRLKAKNETETKLKNLKAELKKAIAKEDFENAAKLRDEIRALEGQIAG